ncbi:PEP-CTERM sorting domain-containing protein [Massilia sp. DWR3-1-1]|uniref:PEP-CTERM sorting domain-containing protein n=1 Tax=Massilia sp. DWR3-1-1 TaxID=2804559 RepID=UPI003CFB7287
MKKFLHACLLLAVLLATGAHASVIRGIGTGALVGGDLTDPENNGNPNANVNYNAVFRSSDSQGFNGEGPFNVFDNQLGATVNKWCCGAGTVWVEADFGAKRFTLSSFTAASANDTPGRDSSNWQIQGSNDGITYTTIFAYTSSVSAWANRNQVNQYLVGSDFAAPAAYSIFRYLSTATINGNASHQLGELEFFGTAVPEPGVPALLGLGLAAMLLARRRARR